MFTVFCSVLLATLALSSACNKDCWFSKKTRSSKNECYGDIRPLTVELARLLGVEKEAGSVCLKHRRMLEKEDERCSSLLSRSHSKQLMAVPRKLYQYLDDHGKLEAYYRPGCKWCNKCRTVYYEKVKTDRKVSNLLASFHEQTL